MGGIVQCPFLKYAPECACLNGHSILVTAWNHSTSVFKRCGLSILFFINIFFIKSFVYNKLYIYISFGAWMSFSYKKREFDRCFTGLTGRSKNLDPTGNPTGRSTRPVPVDPTSFHLWSGHVTRRFKNIFCIMLSFNPLCPTLKIYVQSFLDYTVQYTIN